MLRSYAVLECSLVGDVLDVVILVSCRTVCLVSVAVRPLHDGGRPGWRLLLDLVPNAGIAVHVLVCMETPPRLRRLLLVLD